MGAPKLKVTGIGDVVLQVKMAGWPRTRLSPPAGTHPWLSPSRLGQSPGAGSFVDCFLLTGSSNWRRPRSTRKSDAGRATAGAPTPIKDVLIDLSRQSGWPTRSCHPLSPGHGGIMDPRRASGIAKKTQYLLDEVRRSPAPRTQISFRPAGEEGQSGCGQPSDDAGIMSPGSRGGPRICRPRR